jgi:hypothetical protein
MNKTRLYPSGRRFETFPRAATSDREFPRILESVQCGIKRRLPDANSFGEMYFDDAAAVIAFMPPRLFSCHQIDHFPNHIASNGDGYGRVFEVSLSFLAKQ